MAIVWSRFACISVLLLSACDGGSVEPTSALTSPLTADGVVVSPGIGWADTGATGTPRADGSVDWCCTTWVVPLPVQGGDSVATLDVRVRDNGPDNGLGGAAMSSITAMVGTVSAGVFTPLQFATTNASGDEQSVRLTFPTPHVVAINENLQFRVRAQKPASWPPVPATNASWVGSITVKAPTPQLQGPNPVTDTYSAGFAIPGPGAQVFPGDVDTNTVLSLGTSTAANALPLHVELGRPIVAWSVRFIKNSTSGTITAKLLRSTPGAGGAVQIGTTRNLSAQSVASIGESGLTEAPIANASYFITVRGGGSNGDFVEDYQITQ